MKRQLFIGLVITSLAVAVVLGCGYLARLGLTVCWITPNGSNLKIDEIDISLASGRFSLIWADGSPAGPIPAQLHEGFNWIWRAPAFQLRVPPLWRSIWQFEAHSLPSLARAWGVRAFLFALPLWCLILPSLAQSGFTSICNPVDSRTDSRSSNQCR